MSDLVCYTAFLLLPLVLYRLLSPVGKRVAVLMVAFAVVSVPTSIVNLFKKLGILLLLDRADYLQAFTTEQLQTRVILLLDTYNNGVVVSEIL